MKEIRRRGIIHYLTDDEQHRWLCISSGECLAVLLDEEIGSGKQVSVRYWTSDVELSDDEIKTAAIHELLGVSSMNVGAVYSEWTGYLWTDEEVNIGGHDLINELSSFEGKYVLLEIDVREEV